MSDATLTELGKIEASVERALGREDYAELAQLLQAGLALRPTHARFLHILFTLRVLQKQWRSAIRTYSRFLTLYPEREAQFGGFANVGRVSPNLLFFDPAERTRLYLLILLIVTSIIGGYGYFQHGLTAAAVAVGIVMGCVVLNEVVYRVWLYFIAGVPGEWEAFPENARPVRFAVLDQESDVYESSRGYDLVPNERFVRIVVNEGEVVEAHSGTTDRNGNVGFTDVDSDVGALNVLVLGDSYTNFLCNGSIADGNEGVEWPYFLKNELSKRGYQNVRILNYARSGHGVLQMADTAVSLLQLKPDIVVFAFITRDLNRFRYWHIKRTVAGTERYLRIQTPDIHAPLSICNDHYLVDKRINLDWAKDRMQRRDKDDLLQQLITRYRRLRRRASSRAIDLLSLRHLYSWDRIFFTSPFINRRTTRRTAWKKLDMKSFAEDSQFVSAIKQIQSSGAKLMFVHVPTQEDLVTGTVKFGSTNEPKLLRSLPEVSGEPILFLGSVITQQLKLDPSLAMRKYARHPLDSHPSTWAQKLLGLAFAEMIENAMIGNTNLSSFFQKGKGRPANE